MISEKEQPRFLDETEEVAFRLQRTYLKDISLEMPNSPQIFLKKNSDPKVDINIKLDNQELSKNLFESRIRITVTASMEQEVLYLVEVTQAGIFDVQKVQEQHIQELLHTTCPTILYPYLRSNIADLIVRTSFPPFHLADINFQYLYKNKIRENLARKEQALG